MAAKVQQKKVIPIVVTRVTGFPLESSLSIVKACLRGPQAARTRKNWLTIMQISAKKK